MKHTITLDKHPEGMTITCKCGWHWTERYIHHPNEASLRLVLKALVIDHQNDPEIRKFGG